VNHTLKFAFYGQAISETGRRAARPIREQQLAEATTRVQRHGGKIVADYFDVYPDRHRALHHRREARQLLLAIQAEQRGFDAIIIADTRAALTTIIDYDDLIELCSRHGVRLWLPEIDEPVDRDNEEHQEIIKTKLWGVSPRLWNRILQIAAEEEAATGSAQPDRHSAISNPPPIPTQRTPAGDHPHPPESASPATRAEERS
jgi:site-specific DNA recombinase